MAKQKSLVKVEGTIGDLNFYKTKNGYMVREKSTISPERIATDPAFKRTGKMVRSSEEQEEEVSS